MHAADMPETTRLAETIATWWPAIEAFLRLRITNARTEGSNRVIKQLKRVGCGYRNQATTNAVSSCTSPRRTRRDSDQRGTLTLERKEPLRERLLAEVGWEGRVNDAISLPANAQHRFGSLIGYLPTSAGFNPNVTWHALRTAVGYD